ncbi:hypothetical protein YC2023_107485 [Brassica napus]
MMQSFLYNCKINMFKKMFELDKCNTSPRIETITLSDLKQEELEHTPYTYSVLTIYTSKDPKILLKVLVLT